jgi:hypothetical protein
MAAPRSTAEARLIHLTDFMSADNITLKIVPALTDMKEV